MARATARRVNESGEPGDGGSRPRIAWISPFPPDRGGIGDYSATIVQALAHRAEVDLWTDEPIAPDLADDFRVVDFRREPWRTADLPGYDALIYNVGNHPGFHGALVDLLQDHPGIVILHDMALNNLFLGHLGRARYLARLLPRYGARGALWFARNAARYAAARLPLARRLVPGGFAFVDEQRFTFHEDVTGRATGLVVHSDYVRTALRARGHGGPVATIRHPIFPQPEGLEDAQRPPPDVPADRALLVAVGDVVPYKQLDRVLEALAGDPGLRDRCLLRVIGRTFPDLHPLERLSDRLGLSGNVQFLGFQPLDELYRQLAAADVYLGLRHPTGGETSGALIRAMERGRACVVCDAGWYGELPDDCVARVGAPVDVGELRRVLRGLVDDPARRETLGARAAAHVQAEYGLDTFATRILEFALGPGRAGGGSR